MNTIKNGAARSCWVLPVALVAFLALAVEVPPNARFVITSIAAQGTNVVLTASIPSGLEQVVLEMRSMLDANSKWEEKAILNVPGGSGQVTFTVPKPDGMQLMRLKAKSQSAGPATVSSELKYVTIASLGAATNKSSPAQADAVFHFKGTIDGSDKITITRDGALWEHVNWAWPGPVTVNGAQWDPSEKNYLTTTGAAKFLPESFSLDSADLKVIAARDEVTMERADNALVVYMDDVSNGADDYEFEVRFHPSGPKPTRAATETATLKITADIDGSDCFIITRTEATWRHGQRAFPDKVMLNNVEWFPQLSPVLKNEGTNAFLPATVDLSSAKIVSRKGRDLATMWAEEDAVYVHFADNPNGSDTYELELSFGK